MPAKGSKAITFNINDQAFLAKLRDTTIHFKFNPTLEKGKGGQGQFYKQIWYDGDNVLENPTFVNKKEQPIKYGIFKKEDRMKNKAADMKDKPSFAFGAKSSGDIGEFFMILDDITIPHAIDILNKQLVENGTELSVFSRKITKRTYGGPSHPGDAVKKKQYMDAKDWTITIGLKCDTKTGRCFTPLFRKTESKKFKSGFITTPIDGVTDLNIHEYLKMRTPVRLAISMNKMWIKPGNDRDGKAEYQTMPEIMIKQVECFPLEEQETYFSDDEEIEEEANECDEPDNMPTE